MKRLITMLIFVLLLPGLGYASTSVIFGNTGAANLPVTAGTTYLSPNGSSAAGAQLIGRQIMITTAGTLSKFRVKTTAAPGAGNGWTLTIRVNLIASDAGSPNPMTVNISGDSSTSGQDLTNSVAVSAGDMVTIKCATTGTPGNAIASWSFQYDSTASKESLIFGGSNGVNIGTSGTTYLAPTCASAITTEAQVQAVMPCAGTIKNLYATLNAAPGAGATRTFTLRVAPGGSSTADTALTTTISESDVSNNDTTHSVNVSAGDLINIKCTLTGTPANSHVRLGMAFVATNDGDFCSFITTGNNNTDTGSTKYLSPLSASIAWNATVGNVLQVVASDFTAKTIYIQLSADPGSGKTYAFSLYKNTGDTLLTKTITGNGSTSITGNAAVDVAITAADLLAIECVPGGTPTAVKAIVSICGNSITYVPLSDYYISDATGNDTTGDGTITKPLKTIAKAHTLVVAGKNIWLNRGDTFRETLTVPANNLTYGAFGTGAKPIIKASDEKVGVSGDWTDAGGNVWTRALTTEPLAVYLKKTGDSAYTVGTNDATPDSDYEWFWAADVLSVYATSNPASYYSSIECGARDHAINNGSYTGTVFNDIVGMMTGSGATCDVWSGNGSTWTLNRCEGYYGYGLFNSNCITDHNQYTLVCNDCIFQYGENVAAFSGNPVTTSTITFNRCYILNGNSLGAANEPATSTFTLNDCWIDNCKFGVSRGAGEGTTTLNYCIISNNQSANYSIAMNGGILNLFNCVIYKSANGALIDAVGGAMTMKNCILYNPSNLAMIVTADCTYVGNNNLFFRDVAASNLITFNGTTYTHNTFADYKTAASPQDSASISVSPSFKNGSTSYNTPTDFKLSGGSPCINTGTAIVGLTTDYAGMPIVGNPDMGAYEFLAGGGLTPGLGLSGNNRPPKRQD